MKTNLQWQHVPGDFSVSINHVKHPTQGEIFFTLFVNYQLDRWNNGMGNKDLGPEPHSVSYQIAHYSRPNNFQKRDFYTYTTYAEGVEKMAELLGMTVDEYETMPSLAKTLLELIPNMEWTKPYATPTI